MELGVVLELDKKHTHLSLKVLLSHFYPIYILLKRKSFIQRPISSLSHTSDVNEKKCNAYLIAIQC